jgi:malate dehydrogenase (oxaloacetate-decarboxylating)
LFSTRINKFLALPGIFQGALNGGSKRITLDMKIAAARAIADIAPQEGPWPDHAVADWQDRVTYAVAESVETAACGLLERRTLLP